MTGGCQSLNHQDSSFGCRLDSWTDTWSHQLRGQTPACTPLPFPGKHSSQPGLTFFVAYGKKRGRRGSWWPGRLQLGQVQGSLRGLLEHPALCQSFPHPPYPRPASSNPSPSCRQQWNGPQMARLAVCDLVSGGSN